MSKPFLFQGATGDAVKEAQQRLQKLGFYQGPISGTYTPDTAMAAVALQRQQKLSPVNGGFYAACWDALDRLEKAAQDKPPAPAPPVPKKIDPPPPLPL